MGKDQENVLLLYRFEDVAPKRKCEVIFNGKVE